MSRWFALIIFVCVCAFLFCMVYPAFESSGGRVYRITTCEELQAVNDDLDGVYIVMNDIDCKNFNGENR